MANVLAQAARPTFRPLRAYPPVSTNPADIPKTFASPQRGLDFEWNVKTGEPTIIGFASPQIAVSAPFDAGAPYLREFIERPGRICGHNLTQAEKPILDKLRIALPYEKIDDTILLYWLTNMWACKSEGKISDSDSDYKGRGFMNMWTMLSLYTSFPDHKVCPGKTWCVNRPCPEHAPYWYNGLDAFETLFALPGLHRHMETRRVSHLYPLHVELMDFLYEIQTRGVHVDRKRISEMRTTFAREKTALEEKSPFNVRSPKAALAYFHARGIHLDDWQEETVREACGTYDDPDLHRALECKDLGKGIDSWFADRVWNDKTGEYDGYVDGGDYVHPRLGPFTSTARLQCTSPNLQNLMKRRVDDAGTKATRGWGAKDVPKCIVPYPGHYLVAADYSNAEGNNYLYQGGHPLPIGDFHKATAERMGIKDTDRLAIQRGNAREAAKSVTHGANNLEGLSLIDPSQLQSWKIRQEIDAGARIVYRDWTFEGQIVTFTAINLAQRLFGKATLENRAAVLAMQRAYFDAYPGVHKVHRRITRQIENDGAFRPPNGYYGLSFGEPTDRLKIAAACYGQQPVAHLTKLAMLRARQHAKVLVTLQVHDLILYNVPRSIPVKRACAWVREYQEDIDMPEMPGFHCPVEIAWSGKNLGEIETVYKGGKWLR